MHVDLSGVEVPWVWITLGVVILPVTLAMIGVTQIIKDKIKYGHVRYKTDHSAFGYFFGAFVIAILFTAVGFGGIGSTFYSNSIKATVISELEEQGFTHVGYNWGNDRSFTASLDGEYFSGTLTKVTGNIYEVNQVLPFEVSK